MEVVWLGQAGLLFRSKSLKIMVDPYFSNDAEKLNAKNYRRIPADEKLLEEKIDVLIITHCHADHFDAGTISKILKNNAKVLVLAPTSVWNDIRKNEGEHNYVLFNRGTQWTEKGFRFTAVMAEHSDASAIGVIIDDGEKKYYVTGDTLYNEEIFEKLPSDIYAVFLPVNGYGNNLNMADAKRFAEKISAKRVVPIHCGMFDEIDMDKFVCNGKRLPRVYQKVDLGE